MGKSIDMRGRRYGQLVVLDKSEKKRYWVCQCDCGNVKSIRGASLRRKEGGTKTCGCLRLARLRETICTHAMSGTKIYRLWTMMLDRCRNPKNEFYSRYGGRGIQVCPRWHSFEAFYLDMGDRPDKLSLERKDNDGDYCLENCVWATQKQQTRNTSRNRRLTLNGRSQSLVEWAEELEIKYQTLNTRVSRGWSDEKVLTQPVKKVSVAWRRDARPLPVGLVEAEKTQARAAFLLASSAPSGRPRSCVTVPPG